MASARILAAVLVVLAETAVVALRAVLVPVAVALAHSPQRAQPSALVVAQVMMVPEVTTI